MDSSDLELLGPLARLAGTWEGDKGDDTAPSDDRGTEKNKFRERLIFTPIDPVDNHEQMLYGLRYSTTAWEIGDPVAFHEEQGYWLWDPNEKQVLRCFTIPRGVAVIAGGTCNANADTFELKAELGSETYGICSNRFLDREFKTVRYHLKVTIHGPDSFSYEEDSVLQIKGQKELFHHIDKNTLRRVPQ